MEQKEEKQDLSRIIAISDAIFAFSITLMVLNFDVPIIPSNLVDEMLPGKIYEQVPTLVSYVVSFLAVGSFWYSHHEKFRYIIRYDKWFFWLNLLLLMTVVFIPFATNLVGEYSNSQFAVVLYCISISITGLVLAAEWFYASYHHRLVIKSMPEKNVWGGVLMALVIPIIFMASALVSFLHLGIAKWILIMVIVVPIILGPEITKKFHKN